MLARPPPSIGSTSTMRRRAEHAVWRAAERGELGFGTGIQPVMGGSGDRALNEAAATSSPG